jgi:ribonucleoside-triphosphate reductase
MFTEIKKRDGRIVPFDAEKITEAIFKAVRSVGGENRKIAENLAKQVVAALTARGYNGVIPTVEDAQDEVEKVLINNGHARTAKAYILYRAKRTRIREGKSDLMDTVKEILVETSRENANISNSPSAKMLQIASAASKRYYLTNLLPEEFSQAHTSGAMHIHDLDYYGKTLNCLQIDLTRLLTEGFNTGYGFIRPPKRVASAAAQAAIILQSNQNDMFGGQSFPHFDRSMAQVIRQMPSLPDEEEIFQAMEGLIYNLNTMHSLSGDERIWVLDKQSGDLYTRSMKEFHTLFEDGRYQALSVNYRTGATELKDITASIRHKNVNRLFHVKLKSGQKVTVTDNHSIMTLGDVGEIETAVPGGLRRALVPRELCLQKEKIVFDLIKYPASAKYAMSRVALTPALAKIMGLYVAEGSVDGSTLYLALFNRELETEAANLLREVHPEFSVRLRKTRGQARDLACNVGQRFAAFLADKCGRGAANKRVPGELFFAGEACVKAFLDGYLSGHGTVGANRVVAGTVSRELRDGIQLLYLKLGIPVSLRDALPQSQFAMAKQRYMVSAGGYYLGNLALSGGKDCLSSAAGIEGEQTPYDYSFLRRMIRDVYGIFSKNSYNYRIKPQYLEGIVQDLASRILDDREEAAIRQMAGEQFWFDRLAELLPRVETTERYHLQKKLKAGQLPRFSKYMPVFYPYKEMLSRFFLPETVSDEAGSRIDDNCQSPALVMSWARKVLRQNEKMGALMEAVKRALRLWPMQVRKLEEAPHEEFVYDISVADNENFLSAEGIFVHNSRAGAQVPFSSINLGTDTTTEGRAVTRSILRAFERGLGNGESPIFPNLVFRVREGVNFNVNDPNYDLLQLAFKVAGRRLNPTFSFMDASFNKPYGDEVAYMGCRTRTIGNRHGREVSAGRGNIAPVSINLPRVALGTRDVNSFFAELDRTLRLAARQLLHRFEILGSLRARDLPFLMGQKLYMGSENLTGDDVIKEVIRHGTLAIGFIGLAETLLALIGKHHGEDNEAQALGLAIVSRMAEACAQFAEEFDLNFTLVATPAEGLSGRFIRMDREIFGIIPKITDKEYYTNSYHVPVNYCMSSFDKLTVEGEYHKLCTAGHISYVELESPPLHNGEAVEAIIRHMAASDMGYGGINYPVDECRSCGSSGVFNCTCPGCGSGDIRRIRRITGYLSTEERFNSAKQAELKDRRPHC